MYISMSRLRVAEPQVSALLQAFNSRVGLVENADGFIDLEVWHSDRDPGEVIMVSRWQTREAFTRYMKSDDHKTSHARINPALRQAIRLERLDHVAGPAVRGRPWSRPRARSSGAGLRRSVARADSCGDDVVRVQVGEIGIGAADRLNHAATELTNTSAG